MSEMNAGKKKKMHKKQINKKGKKKKKKYLSTENEIHVKRIGQMNGWIDVSINRIQW